MFQKCIVENVFLAKILTAMSHMLMTKYTFVISDRKYK